MPKENDLEGRQDMGGKHGGQAGMPKPEGKSGAQQGVVKDEGLVKDKKAQGQPAHEARPQQVSRTDSGGDPSKER